jgi:hypothetical protein
VRGGGTKCFGRRGACPANQWSRLGFARRFLDDIRAYFGETNLVKRDEIAAFQALRRHRGGKLRLTDVKKMFLKDQVSLLNRLRRWMGHGF